MKPVAYHREADVELVAAAKRYRCAHEDLGRRFLRAVHVARAEIERDPSQFPFYDRPARSRRVAGFPYRLIYEETDAAIVIIAVAHLSREPGYWKNRLS